MATSAGAATLAADAAGPVRERGFVSSVKESFGFIKYVRRVSEEGHGSHSRHQG